MEVLIPVPGLITLDNVSVDVSAVACFRVADAVKSVIAITMKRATAKQAEATAGPS